ncbi:MAG: 2-oxoacid:ferredoxin oxidoreductase subunit beta [Candidatus Thermoplasmatota archaeon]|nr:2-oxoacid:ferredoxin oxidoreductase subunit beta [Candidatus Thermoplasmatota archaeon]MEC7255137.1 2-oxoacid:ferredoxin oxidoreductase subunit beta [Candidatus Thermoplasmatota archaeon]MEC8249612.1 2-oxoacid:ferredoxin oxidoreductase subunit beta [Candidatus Thermoplasmatota archaeon]MEC8312554.1 2-oxoacid:ferredoxin oxidoreductase subunit beta [Candidatus Thermoplasmatota archaeon]MEC8353669.1 2-oxoacid:ferredoxin oxidoreductase subunit beta [Candidatus Thermoplasmatota archaeon]
MIDKAKRPAKPVKLNVINEPKDSYTGGPSSLCPGCGHDQISNVIINAAWENGIQPHRIAKMSGIGCSSKTPAYYLGQSHGFNTVHGRMPSVTTGAYAVNKDLLYIGVSGDGDSASIGIGQLIHAIRRNMDMVYIIENNGVYGLTKGQYSATADIGSKKKKGPINKTQPIDLCALAINLGCTFVARSFSGSKKQLNSILKAAMSHKGFALIDVISPCVTFNNNDESMKSYGYVKENEITLHMADYIPHFNPITEVEVPEGHFRDITLHDGSTIRLETISKEHDPSDAVAALTALHDAETNAKHVTGLLYFDNSKASLVEDLGLVETALIDVADDELRPSKSTLDEINAAFLS